MSETILYEAQGPVARVTLNKPDKLNGLGPEEWDGLHAAWERARTERDVRCVVLTGAGRAFSAGGDIKTAGERLHEPPSKRFLDLRRMGQVVRAMRDVPKPIVAAVNGPCFGAGFSIALACDLRVCAARASFGAAFSKIGFGIDLAGSYLLPQVLGAGRAMELHLLAEPVDSRRALELGIVSKVFPDESFHQDVDALVAQICEGAPVSFAVIKQQIYRGAELPLETLIDFEAALQALALTTDDAKEGLAAKLENRRPDFKGR